MTLIDNIHGLRERALSDLNAAHDYYSDTKRAWLIAEKAISSGLHFTFTSTITGTITTQADLSSKARGYLAEQIPEATFQQFRSIFEDFLFNFLRLWLLEYPGSLSSKQVGLSTILELRDIDAIISKVIAKELNDISYEKPADWFEYLERKAGLGCPNGDEIAQIAEAKASRDVLAHNRGIANKTYALKAGAKRRYQEGQRIWIFEEYHRQTWELLRKIVMDSCNAAIAKLT